MASPVLSVQHHTLTISGGASTSDQADLTGSPDITNCIPFVTTRVSTVGAQADSFSAYVVRADFVDDTIDKVRVSTSDKDLGSRVIVCEVTVVEFNPAEVNVYQGDDLIDESGTLLVLDDPYGVGVDVVLAKSFLYFTYTTASAAELWRQHTIRGVMTDVDTLTFDVFDDQSAAPDQTRINWYVAEAINTAWAVDPVAIQLTGAQTTNTDTFTALDTTDRSKAFVLGSYTHSDTGAADADGCRENTIDVELTNSTTVTATRLTAGGILDWAGFVVEFASGGNENVYRGTLTTTNNSPDTGTSRTISSPVDTADSMVHTCGMTGVLGGSGNDNSNSDDVPAVFYAWTFASTTVVDCEHYTGQSSFEAADVTWEVIEWDVGGAPPATRRVMVIS